MPILQIEGGERDVEKEIVILDWLQKLRDDCSCTTDKEQDLSSDPEKLDTLSHTRSSRQESRHSNSRWRED